MVRRFASLQGGFDAFDHRSGCDRACLRADRSGCDDFARANCYETIGCSDGQYFKGSDLKQLSCQSLWEVRNWIYTEKGYCFKTPKTIAAFGNAGCLYDDVTQGAAQ